MEHQKALDKRQRKSCLEVFTQANLKRVETANDLVSNFNFFFFFLEIIKNKIVMGRHVIFSYYGTLPGLMTHLFETRINSLHNKYILTEFASGNKLHLISYKSTAKGNICPQHTHTDLLSSLLLKTNISLPV